MIVASCYMLGLIILFMLMKIGVGIKKYKF